MPQNPNIALTFSSSSFVKELKPMQDGLKATRKEFEITNLSIQASGNQMDLAKNKIAGYGKQVELQKAITEKTRQAVEQATAAHSAAAQKVEAARQAYEKASKSENASTQEIEKLKTELERANNTYEKLGKSVAQWNDKLLTSRKAEEQLKVSIKQVNTDVEKQNAALIENIKNTRNVTSATGSLFNAYNLLKGLAVGYAGKKLFDMLIGSNADLEQNKAAFSALLGSADQAQKKLDELYKFAARTPFTFDQTINAEKRLLAYGVAAEKSGKVLQMLGDISMGNAEKLDLISLAYGQVVTNQRLYGTELRQFAENGVPLLDELAKMYGVTDAQMRKMITDGQISADAVTAALERMTSAGGKFYGMMDKQSKTMIGMWSTLKDNVTLFARDVGDEAFGYLTGELNNFMDSLNKASENGELSDMAKNIGHDIANFVKFIVDAVKILWDMRDVLIAGGEALIAFKVAMSIGSIITTVTTAIEAYTTATAAGVTTTKALTAAMNTNPWVLLGSAVAAVIVGIIGYKVATQGAESETQKLIGKTKELTDEYKRNIETASKSSDSQLAEAAVAEKLTNKLDELSKKVNKTNSDKKVMVSLVDQLNEKIPNLNLSINSQTGVLNKQIPTVRDAINAWRELLFVQAGQEEALAAQKSIDNLTDQKKVLEDQIKKIEAKKPKFQFDVVGGSAITADSYQADINNLNKSIKEIDKQISDANKKINDAQKRAEDYAKKYGSTEQKEVKPPPLTEDPDKAAKDAEKAAKKAEQQRKKTFQGQLNELKSDLNTGKITEAKYYDELADLRDKYFKKGSKDWNTYTEQIKKYQDKVQKAAVQQKFTSLKSSLDSGDITDAQYYQKLEKLRDQYIKKGTKEWNTYTEEIKKYKDKAQKAAVQQQFTSLKSSLDSGTISEDVYYKKLAELRDKYFKQGTKEWNTYTEQIKKYQDKLKAETLKQEKEKYDSRLAISEKWISDQKVIDNLSAEDEIAAYERIKAYTEDYYKKGILTAKEYANEITELNKKEYDTRKAALQNEINEYTDAEKKKLDARKDAIEEAQKESDKAFEKRKQQIEDEYDTLDREDNKADRNARMQELLKEQDLYNNAKTEEGKKKLEDIQDEIKSLQEQQKEEDRSLEKKQKLADLQAEQDRADDERAQKLKEITSETEALNDKQKELIKNISDYASITAGTLSAATEKIKAILDAIGSMNVPNIIGGAGTTNQTINNISQVNNNNIVDPVSANIFGRYLNYGLQGAISGGGK